MNGSTTYQSGLRDTDINIDGTVLTLPARLMYTHSLRQFASEQSNGRKRITRPYDGAGLPTQPDLFAFTLEYQFAENVGSAFSAAQNFLENLRTAGQSHTLAFWKQFIYTYTAQAGQSVFYLPRPDAFSKSYSGKTGSAYQAAVQILGGGGTPTVAYQSSVTSATAVPAGSVYISNTAIVHPESKATVSLFKFGTAFASITQFTVAYFPLFTVDVTQIPTAPFDARDPFSENKVLSLVEV